jgi:hypothetical protein
LLLLLLHNFLWVCRWKLLRSLLLVLLLFFFFRPMFFEENILKPKIWIWNPWYTLRVLMMA